MLIVDGVEYKSFTPSTEAELESFVEAHSKYIIHFSYSRSAMSLFKSSISLASDS